MILRSYKMTHEGYNAPNFTNGVLTNALCMGSLRLKWNIDEWMAGFSCQTLDNSQAGQEKLIYIAKVSQKLTLDEFWDKYPQKRPNNDRYGDNIYQPNGNGGYFRIDNSGNRFTISATDGKDKKHIKNIKANCVLVCDEFYYFGINKMLVLPMRKDIALARSAAITSDLNVINSLILFVRNNKNQCMQYRDDSGKLGGSGIPKSGNVRGLCGVEKNHKSRKC